MKTQIQNFSVALALFAAVASPHPAVAQGTAFTYQGRLNDSGAPAHGTYDFRFRIALDSGGNNLIGSPVLANDVSVTNGLFTSVLDFGAGIFAGSNCWLQVEVRTNGGSYAVLHPLQTVTPAPYAVFAENVGSGGLAAGTYGNAVTLNNAANSFTGNGAGLTGLNASQLTSGTMPDARLSANVALLNGTQSFTGQNYFLNGIGIGNVVSGYPIEVYTGQAVERLTTTNSIFGSVVVLQNQATNLSGEYLGAINFNNSAGATPGQIGYLTFSNNTSSDNLLFRVANNVALQLRAGGDFIVGGANVIDLNSSFATIAGGNGNYIQPAADHGVIAGGVNSVVQSNSFDSVISGGELNLIGTNSHHAVISGGWSNQLSINGTYATIGGGYGNSIGSGIFYVTPPNPLFTNYSGSVIGGGVRNSMQAGGFSVIGGGHLNSIDYYSYSSAIGGGDSNSIGTNAPYCTIGGGQGNAVKDNAHHATISGGDGNIVSGVEATVGGGFDNQANAVTSVVAGGQNNIVSTNAAGASIGGGSFNQANSSGAVVPGGYGNVASGVQSFAAGTDAQAKHDGSFVWADDNYPLTFSSTTTNQFRVRATGGAAFVTAIDGSGGVTAGVHVLSGDTAWSSISDKNAKKNFQPVNGEAVLEKLAAIPVQQWNYKWESDTNTPHIGPMAQDFKSAFYPGRDDKSISTLEFDGVELAAIQGLNRKLEQQLRIEDAQMKAKDAKIQQLEQRLDRLERALQK